jgi:hypothetical protein
MIFLWNLFFFVSLHQINLKIRITMKKLFGIFAIIALVAMVGCNQGGVSQEEFDAVSKQLVDKDTEIAQLQDEIAFMTEDLEMCNYERDSLLLMTQPKTGGGKKPATTTTTSGGSGGKGDLKGDGTTTTGGKGTMKDGGTTTTTTTPVEKLV